MSFKVNFQLLDFVSNGWRGTLKDVSFFSYGNTKLIKI